MSWTKLGDELADEARDLTDAEFRTHVEALCWSNRRLLDLHVPKRDVRRFAESPDAEKAVDGLAVKGWWEDRGGDWYIGVRFADWQLERCVLEKRRAGAALRQRRKRLHDAGDHSLCLPGGRCPHVTRDGMRDPGRVGTGRASRAKPEDESSSAAANSQASSRRIEPALYSPTSATYPPSGGEQPSGRNAREGEQQKEWQR